MKLSELTSAVKNLLARADGAMKAEVETLAATVHGQVATLTEQLESARVEKLSLAEQLKAATAINGRLEQELSAAHPLVAEFAALNAALSEACLAGKLIDLPSDTPAEAQKAALDARPATEKFQAYQGALNAALARANVPLGQLPAAPSGGLPGQTLRATQAQFEAMSLEQRNVFFRAGGKIVTS